MKLSKNISINEMLKSGAGERLGIDNAPDQAVIEKLKSLCENVLQPVREHYSMPIRINSGYRCLELNRKIGSKDNSQHVKGEAADIEIGGVDNKDLAEYIQNNLSFDQVILEYYKEGQPDSGWVHVSYVSPQANRKKFFTIGCNR